MKAWKANLLHPTSGVGNKARKKSKQERNSSSSRERSQQFVKVNQYLNLKNIGIGPHGQVFKCLDIETKKEYAIKVLDNQLSVSPIIEQNSIIPTLL